jgi:hypothetical protein
MYRNFVEVTVAEEFDHSIGVTKFVGVIKVGEREIWRSKPKERYDMDGAYTAAEATLALALRELIEQTLKNRPK